jgi:hypothetical protein
MRCQNILEECLKDSPAALVPLGSSPSARTPNFRTRD